MHVFTVPFSSCAFVLLACLATAGGASAAQQPRSQAAPASAGDPVTQEVPFPTAGDAYYSAGRGGAGTIPTGGQTADLFTAGDYVESSIFSVPTTSVTGVTADWTFTDNLNGADELWYVYINGVQVATAALPDCSGCGFSGTVTGTEVFAGIAPLNGGYQIKLILQNTVPSGQGYVTWQDGGTTGLSYGSAVGSAPELPSWAAMLLGFAGLGLVGYRNAKSWRPAASDA